MAVTMSKPTKKNNGNVHTSGYSVSKDGIDSHPFEYGVPTLRKKKKIIEWSNGQEVTFEDYIDLIRRKNPDANKDKQHIHVKDDGLVVKKDSSRRGSQIVTAAAFQRSRENLAQQQKNYSQNPKGKKAAAKKEENRKGRRIRKEVVSGTVPSSASSRDVAELEVYANMNKELHEQAVTQANTGFRRIANDQRRHRRQQDQRNKSNDGSNATDNSIESGSDDADDSEEEESEPESDDSGDEQEEEEEFYESAFEDKYNQYDEIRDDCNRADNLNSSGNPQGSHRGVIGVDEAEQRDENLSTNKDTDVENKSYGNIHEGNKDTTDNHSRSNHRPSHQHPFTTVDEAERCDGNRSIAGNVIAPLLLTILSFILPQDINGRRDHSTKSEEEESLDVTEEQRLDRLPRANLFTPTTPSRLSGLLSCGPDGEDHDFDGAQVSISRHCKQRCFERGVPLSELKNAWKHGSEQLNTDHLDDVDEPTRKFVHESITVITSMDKKTLISTLCDERCEMRQPSVDVYQKPGETTAESFTRIRREVDDVKFYFSCKALADSIATGRQMQREWKLAYKDGHDDGRRAGYERGEGDGYRQGIQDGYQDGYDEGYRLGEQQGRADEWEDLHPRPLQRLRTHR